MTATDTDWPENEPKLQLNDVGEHVAELPDTVATVLASIAMGELPPRGGNALSRMLDFEDRSETADMVVATLSKAWTDPDGYENGPFDQFAPPELPDRDLALLRLGVAFGVEYEQTYPAGRRDEWPVGQEVAADD